MNPLKTKVYIVPLLFFYKRVALNKTWRLTCNLTKKPNHIYENTPYIYKVFLLNRSCQKIADSFYLDYFNFFVTLKIVIVDNPVCKNTFLGRLLGDQVKYL